MNEENDFFIDELIQAETEAHLNEILAEVSTEADENYDYEEEYASEDDIARENGFWVDEDGHWRELDEGDDWW